MTAGKKASGSKKSKSTAKKAPAKIKKAKMLRSASDKTEGFNVVGMGASAGGLEAFKTFFENMPADSGMSFVLVPHLDPSHVSIMPELIQKLTKLEVREAKDGTRVKPNTVYIVPPNRNLAILHGSLQLLEAIIKKNSTLPIDFFSDPWHRI